MTGLRQENNSKRTFGKNALLIGIGNCSRGDDGLGWAFLDRINEDADFPGQVEYRYQLGVEDAALVSRAERVVFVDSYKGELPDGFQWAPCEPSRDFEFTTHVLPPAAVLYYCQDLYGKTPRADLLLIQGEQWELGNGMSPEAEDRLGDALKFFRESLPG